MPCTGQFRDPQHISGEFEPQGSSNLDNGTIRSGGLIVGGSILLVIGIILGIVCLPLAFEDPSTSCAAGHDCA